MSELITRLNCSNCKHVSTTNVIPIMKSELNPNGGVKDQTKEEKVRARKIRLITLPGKVNVTDKHWCNHSEVDQWVTKHMWCRRWEASGMINPK